MKKTTKDTFRRLEEQRQSKLPRNIDLPPHTGGLLVPLGSGRPSYLDYMNSVFTGGGETTKWKTPSGTLGRFAEQLKMPCDLLIDQFEKAGIKGLTADHNIGKSHKDALLAYLRAQHSGGSKPSVELYSQEIIRPSEIILCQEINEELLRVISKDPRLLYQIDPRKFEELVARLFEDQGCEVSLTKRTRDGGYDIMAKVNHAMSSFVILAECKRYNPDNKVGVEIVRGLYGVTEMNKANQGLVITSSYFSKDAREEQLRIGDRIGLKDYTDLVSWLAPYASR